MSEWQPIETAPKDGTVVLLYGFYYRRHWFGSGYYLLTSDDSDGWIANSFFTAPQNDSSGCFTPSHWAPMLKPPKD